MNAIAVRKLNAREHTRTWRIRLQDHSLVHLHVHMLISPYTTLDLVDSCLHFKQADAS